MKLLASFCLLVLMGCAGPLHKDYSVPATVTRWSEPQKEFALKHHCWVSDKWLPADSRVVFEGRILHGTQTWFYDCPNNLHVVLYVPEWYEDVN